MKEYKVEITSEGRAGNVFYKETDGKLTFWWEFSMNGASIRIPSDEKWNSFCKSENAQWATNRKVEIVRRIADETKLQRASTAKIKIENEWINLLF